LSMGRLTGTVRPIKAALPPIAIWPMRYADLK
jgi:hypothetical protein